jgi:hypothetical protein
VTVYEGSVSGRGTRVLRTGRWGMAHGGGSSLACSFLSCAARSWTREKRSSQSSKLCSATRHKGIFGFWYRRIYSLSASRCDGEGVKVGWIVRTPYDIVSIDMTLSLRFKLAASLLCFISHKIDTIAGPTGSASDWCRFTCFFKVYIELRTAWHPPQ